MNWPTATTGLRGPSAREGRRPNRASTHGLARPGQPRQGASPGCALARRRESSTPAELRARRGWSSSARLWRGRKGSAGASERVRGHQQVKAGAWARCQAVAAARRATPAWSRHAAGFLCRGRGVALRRARECGRAGERAGALGWAERGEARTWAAGWAGFGWRARSEAAAQKNRNGIFFNLFSLNF